MNDDLISRQAVTDLIMENDPWWCEGMTRTIFDGIARLPSVDAVPVKRGKWILKGEDGDSRLTCSECKCKEYVPTCNGIPDIWKYCPNCGADMRETHK